MCENLMDKAILTLRSCRPPVDPELTHTIYKHGTMLEIWLQTPACRFSKMGKCSMCDYWDGKKSHTGISLVCEYISLHTKGCDTLLINTCGSVLDDYELGFDDLLIVMDAVSKTALERVIIETHLDFVHIDKITKILSVLRSKKLIIEYGQESTNPDVLMRCLNKPSMMNDYCVLKELSNIGVLTLANVLLGSPFLSVHERIEDSINTIRELLLKPISGVVLFPVNIKQYTLVQYLYDNGYYKRVNAREIFETLRNFDDRDLDRIELAWYLPRTQNNTSYASQIIGVDYCENCGDRLLSALVLYEKSKKTGNRKKIVESACSMLCFCNEERYIYDYIIPSRDSCYEFLYKTLCSGVLGKPKQ
jgi:hypothetical protein